MRKLRNIKIIITILLFFLIFVQIYVIAKPDYSKGLLPHNSEQNNLTSIMA